MKVKNIKSKVAAKVAKGKAKVASKCGKAKKTACIVAVMAFVATVAGCLYPTAPSRSQHLAFENCNFTIIGGGDGGNTNEVARVDIGSQAMAIETSGTESNTNTPTQTTDIKPDIDTTVGGATSGGKGILESAVSALCGSADATAAKADAGTADKCSGGSCSDGSCNSGVCTDCTVK